MSRIPNLPSAGGASGADDFSKRIQAEKDRLAAARQGAQQPQAVNAPAADQQQPAAPPAQTDEQGTGPVGQGAYVVKPGDCISSIAKDSGHFWETIWNDSGNSELKETRKDPNVLLPGDRVAIPALEDKSEDCATEQRHRFRRKGEPAQLRMRLMKEPEPQAGERTDDEDEGASVGAEELGRMEDEPRASVPYTLEVDGETFSDQTDDQGYLMQPIPGNAKRGKLTIEPGTPNETVIPLQLGHLDPITEIPGVKQRLHNLGFDCGDQAAGSTPQYEAALRAFQEKLGLEPTGQADQATRDRLQEVHGS
jgi:hypothetical protein